MRLRWSVPRVPYCSSDAAPLTDGSRVTAHQATRCGVFVFLTAVGEIDGAVRSSCQAAGAQVRQRSAG
jgi:hypothetical protein